MFKEELPSTPAPKSDDSVPAKGENNSTAGSESLAFIENCFSSAPTAEDGGGFKSEIKTVSVSDIEEHPDWAIRDHYPSEEVELLENNIRYKRRLLPLIVLFLVGKVYFIIDGVYRFKAYKKAGSKKIEAEVFTGSMRDALLYRFGANSRHGKDLSKKEKVLIAERMLNDSEWQNFTDTLIADYSGLSDKTVAKIRREKFPSTSEFPALRKSIRNGKIITIDTSKLGKERSKKARETPTPLLHVQPRNEPPESADVATNDAVTKRSDAGVVDTGDSLSETKMRAAAQPEAPDADEIDFDPNLAAQAQVRQQVLLGEVFLVESRTVPGGFHALICGDSTNEKIYQNLSGIYEAGLILTDLPYNRNLKTKIAKGKIAHQLHKIANDNLTRSQYRKLLRKILVNCRKITLDGSAFYIFYGLHETIPTYFIVERELGKIRKLVIWNKSGLRQNWSPDFRDGQECAVYGHLGETMRCWYGTKSQTTMFDQKLYYRSPYELPKKTHPCPKPIPVIAHFIELSLEPGGVVLDPLGGSGSTFVAAEVTGRLSVTIELTPAFVAVQVERAEKLGLRVIRTTIDKLPKVFAALSAQAADTPEKAEDGV
jgi:DNA modification methylase/ParB-like chromosome segregation protein Spo0J